MQWHTNENKRAMPWKGEKDPYKVWLSEIILQQTRVEQGWAYYEKFITKYPTITRLAKAKDEEVFKLWEGLGYYTRCKNLLYTARFIDKEYTGIFPDSYEKITALKGVGPYTAAAISSFCFNLPYAVVDGNVFRVLSRVFGITEPTDSNAGKKVFAQLADKVLNKKQPGLFNQAIMDFGATVCKPALPLCSQCALKEICFALKHSAVSNLPVKEKQLQKKLRWFSYFIIEAADKTLIRKRTLKGIWQNLFEYYLVETNANPAWNNESVAMVLSNQLEIYQFQIVKIINAKPQQLTHQFIKGYFIYIKLDAIPKELISNENQWLPLSVIKQLPFPSFINQHTESAKKAPALF